MSPHCYTSQNIIRGAGGPITLNIGHFYKKLKEKIEKNKGKTGFICPLFLPLTSFNFYTIITRTKKQEPRQIKI